MTDPVATIIIPTFDHEGTIELSIRHALAQTVPVEIFIIGDGVSDSKAERLRELSRLDARINYFHHPKHASRGEPYRHEALQQARGRIVCYLCDRDLWLPGHVADMAAMLETVDFCHSLPLYILANGKVQTYSTDLGMPIHRNMMTYRWSAVPLSAAAHSLAFYRSLDSGWTQTPPGALTDWHFFKKFLRREDCRCASGINPTALTFPTGQRPGWTDEQRLAELERWAARIETDEGRQAVTLAVLRKAIKDRDTLIGHAHQKVMELNRKLRHQESSEVVDPAPAST